MSDEHAVGAQGKIVVFGGKRIRRTWVDEQWYFSVVDIVWALTESASSPKYWDAMKRREKATAGIDLSTFCRKVALTGADGKTYKSDAVNTEGAFRVIQSIPSPKAESVGRATCPTLACQVPRESGRYAGLGTDAAGRACPPKSRRKRDRRRAPVLHFQAAGSRPHCFW